VALHHPSSGRPGLARRVRRAGARGARSLGTTTIVASAVALVCAGTGIGSAATGRAFILGRSNTETSTAALADSRGTPLSLSAPAYKAPLAVNRNVMVRNLNAQYLDGSSASSLQSSGVDTYFSGGSTAISTTGWTEVAGTGVLPAGTYYVTATASIALGSGATTALCMITENDITISPLQEGGGEGTGTVSAAETVAVSAHGSRLEEYCSTNGASSSTAQDAGILAIRVLSSSGTPPAVPGL
jgi:hypothetical protein